MYKLVIESSERAFLPEIRAYVEYFRRNEFEVVVAERREYLPSDFDVALLFHGFHPFWSEYPPVVVGEYHSLSVGRFGRVKDFVKRLLNVRSDLYVFLSGDMRRYMWFLESVRCAYRPMGHYSTTSERNQYAQKRYDVVYSGSIRPGVRETILYLAELGLTVAVVGEGGGLSHGNVTCFGRLDVLGSYEVIIQAKYGLNITPDIFPLNVQDSTKVVEYCALGLGVITNRYSWINGFELARGGRFLDISSVKDRSDVKEFDFIVPSVSDLEWSVVMNRSGIAEKLKSLLVNGRYFE